ncbi:MULTISPECIES: transposase [unclassified Methylococcus]|uniref:transposase n=1 Tax=unclassified Methylococcus TaxID=2618889 RepID=UPI003D7D0274
MIQRAQAGESELVYVDEAGFASQPPNRPAWSKVGETHAVLAKRSQRPNVIGVLLSSGRLMRAKLWQSVTGLWFFGFLMAVIERVRKPMVLKEKGMRFYFLPPYSPELNRIEILWKKMKTSGCPSIPSRRLSWSRPSTRSALASAQNTN